MNHKDDKVLRNHKQKLDKKLKRCPFCNGHAHLENTWTASYWVECEDCLGQVSEQGVDRNPDDTDHHKASMDAAAAAWNKRV
jgi:transcription elongation factor Elf1